jgi:lysophospholipase L1-like esterase
VSALAFIHYRFILIGLFAVGLLGSALLLAQGSRSPWLRVTAEREHFAQQSAAWKTEHEQLLNNDWADLEHFRAANAKLPPPTADKTRVVLMGDSITEGWRWTVEPEGPEMGSFFPGKFYINRGISGQTTPQLLVRFRQDVIDLHPAVVVILAGTNDISNDSRATTIETIESNLASMSELAQMHGIRVVLASVLPTADYPWRPGLQPVPKIAILNQWLRDYAAANHHLYLDLYSPLATSTGALRAELTLDGVHPNYAGYEIMAPLLQRSIDAALTQN